MRFAAWNVAHQIRQRPFPADVLQAFLSLQPDAVVFTEYVPGPDHARVVADLAAAGFAGIHISDRVERQNQILVATRMTSERGPWVAPEIRHQVPPNFLHVVVPEMGLQIVGLRVPMFIAGDSASEHVYREWLRTQANEWGQHPTIIVGDLNVGPHRARSWQWRSLESFAEAGWSLVTPTEGWSYMTKAGHTSRIDHGLLSPALTATDARYVTEAGGMVLAGRHPPALSDHAVLVIDVELGTAVKEERGGAVTRTPKRERIEILRARALTEQPIESMVAVADEFGVAPSTLVSDLQYLLREGFIGLRDLEACGFVRSSSIQALDAIAGRKAPTALRTRDAISKWATVLLNHYDGSDVPYSEADAFAEAALVFSGIYDLKSKPSTTQQGSFVFAANAGTEKVLDPDELVEYAVCTHPRCLRVLGPDHDYPRCPRSHGRPEFVDSAEKAVGLLGEHVLLTHLKQRAKELNLPRMEYLSQGQAFRGVDPTTRKRPDFIVWDQEDREFWIDAKVHRLRSGRHFLLRRADVVIMTRWSNPRVVFFERTDDFDFSRSEFYVADGALLEARLEEKDWSMVPFDKERMKANDLHLHR